MRYQMLGGEQILFLSSKKWEKGLCMRRKIEEITDSSNIHFWKQFINISVYKYLENSN